MKNYTGRYRKLWFVMFEGACCRWRPVRWRWTLWGISFSLFSMFNHPDSRRFLSECAEISPKRARLVAQRKQDSGSGVASSSQRARNVGWISFATPSELWALNRIPNTERCWVWVKLRVSKTGKKRNSATKSPKKSASFMSPSNSVKMDTMVTMTHDPSTSIQPLRVSRLSGSPNGHSIQAAIPSFRATGRLWLELQTNRCFLLATFKTWTHFKVHVKETVFFWFLLLEVCNHYKCKLQV